MPSRERPSFIFSILKESYQSVTRNALISTAAALAIIAAMLVLGVFIIFSANTYTLTSFAEDNLEIRIFLKEGVSEEQKGNLYNALTENESVKSVVFESKEEALENFANELEDNSDLLDIYTEEDNPLPESFIVKANSLDELAGIRDMAEEYEDEVEYVRYQEDLFNSIRNFTTFVNVVAIFLLIVISIIAFFLIYNTIRLTVANRKTEIEIMKDVGATDTYIRTPFILTGSFLGLISAFISVLLVSILYYYVIGFVNGSLLIGFQGAYVTPQQLIAIILFSFTAYGLCIGSIGAAIATHKYLNV